MLPGGRIAAAGRAAGHSSELAVAMAHEGKETPSPSEEKPERHADGRGRPGTPRKMDEGGFEYDFDGRSANSDSLGHRATGSGGVAGGALEDCEGGEGAEGKSVVASLCSHGGRGCGREEHSYSSGVHGGGKMANSSSTRSEGSSMESKADS